MTDIISESDILALISSVPDVVDAGGLKRRAVSFLSTRALATSDGSSTWRCAFPREGTVQIGDEVARVGLAPISFNPVQMAGCVITMQHPDGRVFTVSPLLVQALLGWLYVGLERGEIVPADPVPAATPSQDAP